MIPARPLPEPKAPTINVPHFRFILAAALEGYGKAPSEVDVERIAGTVPLMRVSWTAARQESLSVREATVIERGGPGWVAELIMATRSKRREMLREAA